MMSNFYQPQGATTPAAQSSEDSGNSNFYLPSGMITPAVENDGLDAPYWEGAARNELWVQRCKSCRTWQWGPEWICHKCLSLDMGWEQVEPTGNIYAWERAWHPVHPKLKGHTPYLVVLVELPQAGNIRMVGNLLGDPMQEARTGTQVQAAFEHHKDASPSYTLVHWRLS